MGQTLASALPIGIVPGKNYMLIIHHFPYSTNFSFRDNPVCSEYGYCQCASYRCSKTPFLVMHKTCHPGQGKKLAGRTAAVVVVVVVVVEAGEVEGATKEVETTCAFRLMISFYEV